MSDTSGNSKNIAIIISVILIFTTLVAAFFVQRSMVPYRDLENSVKDCGWKFTPSDRRDVIFEISGAENGVQWKIEAVSPPRPAGGKEAGSVLVWKCRDARSLPVFISARTAAHADNGDQAVKKRNLRELKFGIEDLRKNFYVYGLKKPATVKLIEEIDDSIIDFSADKNPGFISMYADESGVVIKTPFSKEIEGIKALVAFGAGIVLEINER